MIILLGHPESENEIKSLCLFKAEYQVYRGPIQYIQYSVKWLWEGGFDSDR